MKIVFGALLFCMVGLIAPVRSNAQTIENGNDYFESKVRPILLNRCGKCHGADKQWGDLRLDSRETALRGGESGVSIIAGKPDDSLLIKAVRRTGDVSPMPPEETLEPHEVEALTHWVEIGTPWPDVEGVLASPMAAADSLWSLKPVAVIEPPISEDNDWNHTRIDRYVHAMHVRNQVQPSGLADKRTLLRRVTYDLTGLPPTLSELHDFLNDDTAQAYERVVERMLASRQYGERWGRHWLDVARYADTAGDGADYPTPEAFRYRNYVINAFNNDKPYDEFLREQLAGDLIASQALEAGNQTPEQYAERVIATGFLAVGKRFGYNDNTEFVHLDIADSIDSIGRSLMGMSLGCARCHDHKYDPVSTQDYYSLYGILASSRFSFPGGEELQRPKHLVPILEPKQVAKLEQQRATELADLDGRMSRLQQELSLLDKANPGGGVDLGLERQEVGKPLQAPWISAGTIQVLAEAQSPFNNVHPKGKLGVRVRNTTPHDGVRREFAQHTPSTSPKFYFNLDFRNATQVESDAACRLYLGHGAIISLAFESSISSREFHLRNGSEWELISSLQPDAWYNLSMELDLVARTYRGTLRDASGTATIEFADKKLNPSWDGIIDTFVSDGIGKVPGEIPTRDLDNLGLQSAPFPPPQETPAGPEDAARVAAIGAELVALKKQREEIVGHSLYDVAYAVTEGQPTNVRIQKRGEPERLGDEVRRRNLSILGGEPVPDGQGSGRMQLANWIASPTNPLTARVLVNRVWQWHFGKGLVRSASDFGTRGDLPSHPELLDDLAATFIRDGWSIKSLHRAILLSRVYRLSSEDIGDNRLTDPANEWFWQYSRRPLDAESIRDSMLAFSGTLDSSMPSGHPFPPTSQWNFTIHYPFKASYDSKHRSVYLMVQRSVKHQYLSLFDGADPNISTADRFATTTPTQALYLMNSPFVAAQSAAFAKRVHEWSGTEEQRVRQAVESVLGRQPNDAEVLGYLHFLDRYQSTATSLQLTKEQLDELAWTALVRTLMTSNEFLFVE